MTPQQIASILERVLPLVLANAPEVNKLAAIRLEVAAMKRSLENIEKLLADDDPTPPAVEEIKPAAAPVLFDPIVTTAPASIEAAAQTEAEVKASKWAKFWDITRRVAKVAIPVAVAGATGGAALPVVLPGLIEALTDPAAAGASGAAVAGLVSTGVRVYGAMKEK